MGKHITIQEKKLLYVIERYHNETRMENKAEPSPKKIFKSNYEERIVRSFCSCKSKLAIQVVNVFAKNVNPKSFKDS